MIRLWLGTIAASIVATFAAYWRGRSDADARADAEEGQQYVETRKRMDDAHEPDSVAAARRWLRDRSER